MAGQPVRGIDTVLRNLNREIKKIEGRTSRGLVKAGLLVRRRSQEKTPVDTGNLRGSAYSEQIRSSPHVAVEIGYTAFYAVYVHERLELRHTVGEAKFLENALKRSERDILRIVAEEARIR